MTFRPRLLPGEPYIEYPGAGRAGSTCVQHPLSSVTSMWGVHPVCDVHHFAFVAVVVVVVGGDWKDVPLDTLGQP